MYSKRMAACKNSRLTLQLECRYVAGDEYTIADIAIWPWYGNLARGQLYDAGEFLQVADYAHVVRWANEIAERRQ